MSDDASTASSSASESSPERARAIRNTVLFAIAWAVVSAGVFLFLAGFFTQWSGVAVSVRDGDPDQSVYQVLIVDDAGESFEADWPARAIEGLSLPIDPLALPPSDLPDDLPRTEKERWAMAFTVASVTDGQVGTPRRFTTTQVPSLGIALLVFVIGLGARNMMVAGSPFSIEPRGVTLPAAQSAPGSVAGGTGSGGSGNKRARGRKGPPPPKRRRGGGRRRR